jgi:hypothetical protein
MSLNIIATHVRARRCDNYDICDTPVTLRQHAALASSVATKPNPLNPAIEIPAAVFPRISVALQFAHGPPRA